MKYTLNRGLVKFYLWLGLAYFLMGTFGITGYYPGRFGQVILNNLWGIIYVVPLNFILLEYSLPFVARKKKYLIYNILLGIAVLFVHCMFYSYGSYAWRLLGEALGIYSTLENFSSLNKALQFQMTYSAISVFIFGIARHIYNFVKLRQATQNLQIEKQAAELNYLRSQTNPHFLFNTLNNIYSLARDKSELAAESILRLSKILRFMLYETSSHQISIEQEIQVISDYIALEQLRYDTSLRLNFSHDVENPKEVISPLLLIPLVENAFKHGVSESRNQPFVNIQLTIKNRQLVFTVQNSTGELAPGQAIKENIGLSNLRRQLELLYRDFSLYAGLKENVFTADLRINLLSHV
jgi:two-component system, LytTR family, sensor kinase